METPVSGAKIGRAALAAFAAALLIKTFLVDLMVAEGRSMLPTLKPGTILLINRAAYGLRCPFGNSYLIRWAAPRAGELVVFPSPDGSLAIKRCVAGPGDPVPENIPLAENHYIVPADFFLVLGDNRDESFDSRDYGWLPVASIQGRMVGL